MMGIAVKARRVKACRYTRREDELGRILNVILEGI